MEKPKRKPGRPPKAPNTLETVHVGFYVTPEMKQKLKDLGGTKWLKHQLEAASLKL